MWGQESWIVGQNGASQRFAQNHAGAITLKYNGIFLDPRQSEKGLIRQVAERVGLNPRYGRPYT